MSIKFNRRMVLLSTTLGSCLAPMAWSKPSEGTPKTKKSLWVWRTPLSQLGDVVALARQMGVTTLFYSIPPDDRSRVSGDFVKHIQETLGEIKIWMAAGDNNWVDGRFANKLPPAVQQLLELQARTHLFQGLCLDIEPHARPDWKTDRQRLVTGYVDLFTSVKKACQAQSLGLGAAIHPAYANISVSTAERAPTLLATCLPLLNVVSLMAYRNTADGALRFGAKAVALLAASPCDWWFGVTTQDGPDAALISYHGKGRASFEADLADLDAKLRGGLGGASYRGIAIQQYSTVAPMYGGKGNAE